jgi:uncharacterized protein YjiK
MRNIKIGVLKVGLLVVIIFVVCWFFCLRDFNKSIKQEKYLNKTNQESNLNALNTAKKDKNHNGEKIEKNFLNDQIKNQILKMPIVFLNADLDELSGLTFFNGFTYMVSDNGDIIKLKNDKILLHKKDLIPDAEGLTHDNKYLYALSEKKKTIYKLDDEFHIIDERELNILQQDNKNTGLEGIAYYKDTLFFVVHQSAKQDNNVFIVDFTTGNVIKKTKLKYTDLAGTTFFKNKLYVVSVDSLKIVQLNPINLQVISTRDIEDVDTEGIDIQDDKIYLIRDNETQLKKEGRL